MSPDPNKKTPRSFQCRESLWQKFEQMAKELECSVDYLINDAMKQYARQRGYSGSGRQTDAGVSQSAPSGSASLSHSPVVHTTELIQTNEHEHATTSGSGAHHLTTGSGAHQLTGGSGAHPNPMQGAPPPYSPPGVRAPTQPRPAAPGVIHAPPPIPAVPPPAPPAPGAKRVPTTHNLAAPPPIPGAGSGFPAAPPPVPGRIAPPPPAPRGVPSIQPPVTPRALFIRYQGQAFPVNKDRFIIGRGKQTSDLTIKDPNVSRQHAVIEFANGQYFISDMGSTNGIEYQGQRVQRRAIVEGDIVKICDHELAFSFH